MQFKVNQRVQFTVRKYSNGHGYDHEMLGTVLNSKNDIGDVVIRRIGGNDEIYGVPMDGVQLYQPGKYTVAISTGSPYPPEPLMNITVKTWGQAKQYFWAHPTGSRWEGAAWVYLTSQWDGVSYGDPLAVLSYGPRGAVVRENYS